VLTSTDVSGKLFRVALRGYSEEEVDVFLDRVVKALVDYEAGRRGDLTAQDIEQQTFRVALRGYAEEEVDQFLDEVVITLREYERRETERPAPMVSVPAESASMIALPRSFLWERHKTPGVLEASISEPDAAPQTKPGRNRRAAPPELWEQAEKEAADRMRPTPEVDAAIHTPTAQTEPVATETPSTPPSPPTVEPTPTTPHLIVTRSAEARGRPYTVLFDDKPLGKVSAGATQRFKIPTGTHWITVKTRKEQSNTRRIFPPRVSGANAGRAKRAGEGAAFDSEADRRP
jgi:DivIVA domain-containing protein